MFAKPQKTFGSPFKARRTLAALLLIFSFSTTAFASSLDDAPTSGTVGLGLNYPGLGVRYFLTDQYSLEAKAQIEKDTSVGGLRAYRYFSAISGILPFAGLEADYISFKGDGVKGSGFAGSAFLGGEFFFARSFSAQFDFGPSYIQLKDKKSSLSVSGIEYVMNIGLNYYFGGDSDSRSYVK